MPERDWLHVAAVGGCLIAALLLLPILAVGQERPDNKGPVGQYAESEADPEKTKAAFDAWFWRESPGSPETYRAICQNPQDRDYADLCQQWRSAKAAEESARWAFPQFVANILTVIGLIATVIYTAKATRATERAVQYIPHLERASVYMKQTNFIFVKAKDGKLHELNVDFLWENGGNTETRRMLTYTSWGLFEGDIPSDYDFPDRGDGQPGQCFLGPKGAYHSETMKIAAAYVDLVIAGSHKIYVWGWTDYDDIFPMSRRHRTEFCIQVYFIGSDEDGLPVTRNRFHKKHNGVEDDCYRKPAPYSPPA